MLAERVDVKELLAKAAAARRRVRRGMSSSTIRRHKYLSIGGAPLMYPAPRRTLQRIDDTFVVAPPSEADDANMPYCPTGYRPGGLTINGATMGTVAEMLSLPPGRVLLGTITVDHTGLTGRYSLELGLARPPGPNSLRSRKRSAGTPLFARHTRRETSMAALPGPERPTLGDRRTPFS